MCMCDADADIASMAQRKRQKDKTKALKRARQGPVHAHSGRGPSGAWAVVGVITLIRQMACNTHIQIRICCR